MVDLPTAEAIVRATIRSRVVRVTDMMRPDGRVFLKSEFGLIGDEWPCFSFTKKSLAEHLQAEFRPGRDIIIYVGTTSPERTENPDHRSRLISAVCVEPNQVLETRRIVPEARWRATVARYGELVWRYSMPVTAAAVMVGPPFAEARVVVPNAYASFSSMQTRGTVVEAQGGEREAVMQLEIVPVTLQLSESVRQYMQLMASLHSPADKLVKQAATRMATLIEQRVKSGGIASLRTAPVRTAPNLSDLIAMLTRKWTEGQRGRCALCDGPLVPSATGMLKPSADRIESSNPSYAEANVQITHLACNLAKNQYGSEDFANWLAIVRQHDEREPDDTT
jgi:hypothetical protein